VDNSLGAQGRHRGLEDSSIRELGQSQADKPDDQNDTFHFQLQHTQLGLNK
jgi:hypothetical protein